MKLEVLHIDECEGWTTAVERTREALATLDMHDVTVIPRRVTSGKDAAGTAFAGSPTIVADGIDLFPSTGQTSALACRVYLTPQGLADAPTAEQISEAIRSRL
jgi:hypothetical protein